ncbi:MAG: patatin-like phospholipase family protein [Nitrospirota bacterium]|nr:patatin-like phospholipase family protein [Nitrospirota bacterium]MDH5585341.1 patatin-like phospholipase family protein [Nitrospirota bacterium]MDH5774919.1 patatin-like phospholipase family protein [Nitrospirota bacterium]
MPYPIEVPMYPHRPLLTHLDPSDGPKRILSLDGGGVRGILTLQYLKKIEKTLRSRYENPDFVLADYFDLIGGTSTGSIIAAGLALGFSVDKIESLYKDLATRIFKKPFFRLGALIPKFGVKSLISALQDTFGTETTLGSPALLTGLMIMTKRMDTGSPWPLTNHPNDPYFQPVFGKQRIGNANMLLWQIVRASTAAPHYFRPECLEVGRLIDPQTGKTIVVEGQFVDGGISTANNPSLELLKIALLDGFRFQWASGKDKLLLVSIGTGLRNSKQGWARGFHATAGAFAFRSLLSIMDDCNREVETLMQWLSNSPTARRINGQILDLSENLLGNQPLLSYCRYNILFESNWVQEQLKVRMDQNELDSLSAMDLPQNMDALANLGAQGAEILFLPEHLPAGFDPPMPYNPF